jgi:hypothetical protein
VIILPQEYDFMKSRDEKGMPEEEFKTVRGEYSRKADVIGVLVKKIIFMLTSALIVSFIILSIVSFATEDLPEFSFVPLVVFKLIFALLLYDPKVEEDKKYRYETDQKIILKSLEGKIKANKIRLGAVIVLGIIAVFAHIGCWWFVIDIMREYR